MLSRLPTGKLPLLFASYMNLRKPMKLVATAMIIFSIQSLVSSKRAYAENDDDRKKWEDILGKKVTKSEGSGEIGGGDPLQDFLASVKEILPTDLVKSSTNALSSLYGSGLPHEIGYGFMMGYSSGFALKKISKLVAFAVGSLFIVVQVLSYNDIVQVNYPKLQKEVESVLDLNKDGKVDAKDAELAYEEVEDLRQVYSWVCEDKRKLGTFIP